jgi:hypothetical protein
VAPLLWTGLISAVLGVVNPALSARVDRGWFIASQIAFGLAAGFVIARLAPIATMQTWPLAARAGVEAIMWVPGSIAFLLPAVWIVGQMLSPQAGSVGRGGTRRGDRCTAPGVQEFGIQRPHHDLLVTPVE